MSCILAAQALRLQYGADTVLQTPELIFKGGTVTALLGPNGSGKSTLLRCLAGLKRPSSGSVHLDKQNIHQLKARRRSQLMACQFQRPKLNFDFSVEALVALGETNGANQKYRQEAMASSGIAHLSQRKWSHLSGGEQQRVWLAQCLASRAPVLFLDEPDNHLDLKGKIDLLRLLKSRNQSHQITILCTHDLNMAQDCDHVMLLKDGKLLFQGSPEQCLSPRKLETAFNLESFSLSSPGVPSPHPYHMAP